MPGGIANFRFAAAACVPPGTPFFPVAWHDGPASLAVGCETPRLLLAALAETAAGDTPEARVRVVLDRELTPVAALAKAAAEAEGWRYGGLDPSPAPGLDSSIGAVIEAVRLGLFGGAGTLSACSTLTAALKSLSVDTCGYAGLMLPVLEDPVLATRAAERRYSVRDLLLYSSVCGTGLDVVPLAGDVREDVLAPDHRRRRGHGGTLAQAAVGAAVPGARREGRRSGALRRPDADFLRRHGAGLISAARAYLEPDSPSPRRRAPAPSRASRRRPAA